MEEFHIKSWMNFANEVQSSEIINKGTKASLWKPNYTIHMATEASLQTNHYNPYHKYGQKKKNQRNNHWESNPGGPGFGNTTDQPSLHILNEKLPKYMNILYAPNKKKGKNPKPSNLALFVVTVLVRRCHQRRRRRTHPPIHFPSPSPTAFPGWMAWTTCRKPLNPPS